jgi:hypothetical protein
LTLAWQHASICISRSFSYFASKNVIGTYSLLQEFGLKEHYGKEARAKYPSDWVTDSARINRACKQLKAEAQELEEYITQDLDPKQRSDK